MDLRKSISFISIVNFPLLGNMSYLKVKFYKANGVMNMYVPFNMSHILIH